MSFPSPRALYAGNLFGGLLFGGGLFQDTDVIPPSDTSDVCLTATRTGIVNLSASTEHARECEGGDGVACSALTQTFGAPPGGTQLITFTLPAADVPTGGIGAWTIAVGFSASQNVVASHTESATVTVVGSANVTDAEFTITLDSADLTGFTFGSIWFWSAWRTNTGEEEVLSGSTLIGMDVVPLS